MTGLRPRLSVVVRRLRDAARHDDGVAMILVMGWGLLMMGLVLVVSQTVVNQIRPSDRSEHSFAALSAAEAGLADIAARLQVGTIQSVTGDATNAALTGWVPVPGGNTDSEYTYALDATKSGAVGEVRAFSTGRSGGVVRTVEEVLSKRSTLDYVYMSDVETPAPFTPGVYSTATYGSSGLTYQQIANLLCTRHWYEPGPVRVASNGTVTQGTQRSRFCRWAGIFQNEVLQGKVHTNDVWWLDNRSLTSTLDLDGITSSCRSTAEGLPAGSVGCPQAKRFLNAGPTASWSNQSSPGDPTAYQGDAWAITGTDATLRNPAYDSVLDLPPSPDLLKQRAAETGCIFTGPTRIRFADEGGIGYMYVTSPDTKRTRAGCDGANGTTLQSPATAQVTRKVDLTDFTDLVIYVQNVRPSTEADIAGADYNDPDQKYYWEKQNRWVAGTEPTCTLKAGRKYPYVVPNDSADAALFASGSTLKGFPSELADVNSPWYGSACAAGDLYVQGNYRGAIMLASDNNIIVTGSLRDSQVANPAAAVGAADFGKPKATSESVLGIAAAQYAYAYRPLTMPTQASTYTWASNRITVTFASGHGLVVGDPVYLDFTSGAAASSRDGAYTIATVPSSTTYTVNATGSGTGGNVTAAPRATANNQTWVADWRQANADNPVYNFALLAIQNCWASQNYDRGPNNGQIYLWGSIAQKFRCAVGISGSSAYGKSYKYDERLTQRTPPYMLELSDEPWGKKRMAEVTPARLATGVAGTYPLLRSDDPVGATVRNVKLASAPSRPQASLTTPTPTSASVSSTVPGLVVVTFEVVTSSGRDVRRLVILVG